MTNKTPKAGAPQKYKKALTLISVRIADDKDKAVIRATEKKLLKKHLIKLS
jgi:hypothetical protein